MMMIIITINNNNHDMIFIQSISVSYFIAAIKRRPLTKIVIITIISIIFITYEERSMKAILRILISYVINPC